MAVIDSTSVGVRTGRYVGASLPRKEDAELLTGTATFTGDISLPGMVHAAFLRSEHAHARILGVDLTRARSLPGVVAAFGGRDVHEHLEVARLPLTLPHPNIRPCTEYPLAWEKVRYVGEPVAVVLARTRAIAEDAVELIDVDYEPLPACLDIERALEPGAPVVHDEAPDNVGAHQEQAVGDVERAFREAAHVFHERLHVHRGAGHAIETRAILAAWEPRTKALTVWATSQGAHRLQRALSNVLGVPEHRLRVITPHVGGGFGPKGPTYPETVVIPWAAMRVGLPVKWVEDRHEHCLAAKQERDQVHHVAVAVDDRGVIQGMKDSFIHDTGAYTTSMVVPWITSTTIPGPYRVPSYAVDYRMAFTNKVPASVVRGAGRPQAVFVMERMLERVAAELGIDRAEVRRRNLVRAEDQPYDAGVIFRDNRPMVYDSGDYPACLDKALELVGYAGFPARQREAAAAGRRLGLGIAGYVEGNGLGPFEGATVRVGTDGQVLVFTGATPQGQGHHTTFSQICADQLGVPPDQITVVTGDTGGISRGIGTFASRSTVVAGNAVHEAAGQVRDKALRVAGGILGSPPEGLTIRDGTVALTGDPDRSLELADVARAVAGHGSGFSTAGGMDPMLEATVYFKPEGATYSCGFHAAVVEVDPETGFCRVDRYVAVDDCGRVVNPMLVHGQLIGGIAHGIGNALYERLEFDESGQPLSTSFMDYLLPGAAEMPPVTVATMESPSPRNPLGVKGGGESGTLPAPAAVALAVENALAPEGAHITALPLSPERIAALTGEEA